MSTYEVYTDHRTAQSCSDSEEGMYSNASERVREIQSIRTGRFPCAKCAAQTVLAP